MDRLQARRSVSAGTSRNGGQGHYSLAGEGRELPEERGSERGLVCPGAVAQ